MMAIPTIWQAWTEHTTEKIKKETQIHFIRKIAGTTDSFLDLISDMIFYGSDGWLPTNENEFFSQRTANLICNELNIDIPLPTYEGPARQNIAYIAKQYRDTLSQALSESYGALEIETLQKVHAVESKNYLISIMEQTPAVHQFTNQHKLEMAPLLCWGMEPSIEQSLQDLMALTEEIKKEEKRLGITKKREWLVFQKDHSHLGDNRFTPEALKEWRGEHPSGLPPMIMHEGRLNKQ